MSIDYMVRDAAIAVAGLIMLWPYLPDVRPLLGPVFKSRPRGNEDLQTVLALASRFRDDGNTNAVSLCQELLDTMLRPDVKD